VPSNDAGVPRELIGLAAALLALLAANEWFGARLPLTRTARSAA
jgi:hypothetical protein